MAKQYDPITGEPLLDLSKEKPSKGVSKTTQKDLDKFAIEQNTKPAGTAIVPTEPVKFVNEPVKLAPKAPTPQKAAPPPVAPKLAPPTGAFNVAQYKYNPDKRQITADQFKDQTEPKYMNLRDQASDANQGNLQGQMNAMERRFAQLGGGPADAKDTQMKILAEDVGQELQGTLGSLNAQQLSEMEQIAELEKAKQFAGNERLAQQAFDEGQRIEQQNFATLERLQNAKLVRDQTNLEAQYRLGEQKQDQKTKEAIAKLENTLKQEELAWQQTVDEYNMKTAESMLNRQDIFSRMGDLGTGLWEGLADTFRF